MSHSANHTSFMLPLVSPEDLRLREYQAFHKLPGKVSAKGRGESRQLEDLEC